MFEMMMNRKPQMLAGEQIYHNYYFTPQPPELGQMRTSPAFPLTSQSSSLVR